MYSLIYTACVLCLTPRPTGLKLAFKRPAVSALIAVRHTRVYPKVSGLSRQRNIRMQ
jgi:hypothetical protein